MTKGEIIAILIILLMIGVATGYISFNLPGQTGGGNQQYWYAPDGTKFTDFQSYSNYMQQQYGTTPSPETHGSAALYLQVCDWITGAGVTTATTTVDVCRANNGVFDLLTAYDTKTQAANPQAMNNMVEDGAKLLLVASCDGNPTSGLDYYTAWFYVEVHENNPVYYITDANLIKGGSSSHYTYTVNLAGAQTTGYNVHFTSGTTNYWDIGKIYIYPRNGIVTMHMYLSYAGADLASVIDGATWIDTDAEITANATLASDAEHLQMNLISNTTNLGWGWQELVVTSSGEVQTYKSVIAMGTKMTAIDISQLQQEGWTVISDSTMYAGKIFYKPIGPYYTTKGSKWSQTIQIPVYCSAAAASTEFLFTFWVIDMQLPGNLDKGSMSTSVPTVYGFITSYGLGQMVHALAYTVSSGVPATPQLEVYLTTAA
jgi:hypothetical protein